VYPVTARGNERREIFRDDADREHFLRVLGESVGRCAAGWFPCLPPETPQDRLPCPPVPLVPSLRRKLRAWGQDSAYPAEKRRGGSGKRGSILTAGCVPCDSDPAISSAGRILREALTCPEICCRAGHKRMASGGVPFGRKTEDSLGLVFRLILPTFLQGIEHNGHRIAMPAGSTVFKSAGGRLFNGFPPT